MEPGKLGKVATLAKIDEEKSSRVLKVSQRGHQLKCDQLEQLIEYKQEYENRFSADGQNSVAARQLQDYRMFLGKLNQAISQQRNDVQLSEQKLDSDRTLWLSRTQRHSALNHLLEQEQEAVKQAVLRVEQKESDEDTLARRMRAENA
ncbi:MAG: flagellar FliJ protein [Halieaceae bacterium]|jgi:flagellar FliJ protein